jgi:isoleucyl-tRNA synthetase
MADYSKTLNLPRTEFPMRGNLPVREPEMQKWWDEIDIEAQVRAKCKGKHKFVLHDGPPYANGQLHIGHALNKGLKDFVVRYKSLQGFATPYVPGWDTHGLPIEHAVVTQKGVDRKQTDPLEFRKLCQAYALFYVEQQREQFKRLGVRGDWKNPYITLEPQYEAAQIRVFGEMVKKGYIYRGMRSIYWSPSSETALAEAEIEYRDKRSASIYVLFPVKDGKGILAVEDTYVVIWTTTPWTLPANLAIALNKEFDYSLVQVGERQLLLATSLVEQVMNIAEITTYQVGPRYKGKELEGILCHHPFYERESPLLLSDHVTLDTGTGCVHIAPGHGEEDFALGQRYQLDVLCPVDGKGRFTAQAPGFAGLFYEDGNKKVTEKLAEVGCLLQLTFLTHSYPHDWRTKKPIIFRTTEQWFASIDGFRQQMLAEIKQVQWTPSWGETRLHNMVADRGDWCISRQRVWGVPLPIFYCAACNHAHITEETISFIADLFAQEGSSAWFAKDVDELMPAGQVCAHCGSTHFRKETDTMDVWFDSGSSHVAVLEQREELRWPADLYLEGSDQYRGWFHSSLATAVATRGKAPYKQVLSHGFTMDGEGRKMSKSLGNVIEPAKVMQQFGADILRLWVASVDYQSDQRISDAILKQIAEVYRKWRNTFRFLLGNLTDFQPQANPVPVAQMRALDRYALSQLQALIQRVTEAYEYYEFHQVYAAIHHFCTVFLSQFYLDVLKDRLYVLPTDSPIRLSAQAALYEILIALVKMISPILPHTADEVWQHIPDVQEVSVQLAHFPTVDPNRVDKKLEAQWDELLGVRAEVLKALEEARAAKMIGNSLNAAVTLTPHANTYDLLNQAGEELTQLFIVSAVTLHPPAAEVSAQERVQVKVQVAPGEKCERCWNHSPSVGESADHPTLCSRCVAIVREYYPGTE